MILFYMVILGCLFLIPWHCKAREGYNLLSCEIEKLLSLRICVSCRSLVVVLPLIPFILLSTSIWLFRTRRMADGRVVIVVVSSKFYWNYYHTLSRLCKHSVVWRLFLLIDGWGFGLWDFIELKRCIFCVFRKGWFRGN